MEVLILLIRERRSWPATEIASHFALNEDHVLLLLDSLVRSRLIVRSDDRYRFSASSAKARDAEELASLYDRFRLRITNIVFARPSDQVRDFAEAFRIRGPYDEDENEEDV